MWHAARPIRTHTEPVKTDEGKQVVSTRVRTKEQADRKQHAEKRKREHEEIQARKETHVKRIEALKKPKRILSTLFER